MKLLHLTVIFVCTICTSPLLAQNKILKPNILCILVEDLGFGDLSCQGATDLRTPNIDRIFQQGMTFTNFYAKLYRLLSESCFFPKQQISRYGWYTQLYPPMGHS